jgi:hypothetical protein
MQRRVRGVFELIGLEINGVGEDASGNWVTVDAGYELYTVAEVLWKHVEPMIKGIEAPIQRLWETLQG